MGEDTNDFQENFLENLSIDDIGADLPKFAMLLTDLMDRVVLSQLRLAYILTEDYNSYARSRDMPLKDLQSTQSTISKLLRGNRRPEYETLIFIVRALRSWYNSEEVKESSEATGYTPKPFTEEEAKSLFFLSGHPLPGNVKKVVKKTTASLAAVPRFDDFEKRSEMKRIFAAQDAQRRKSGRLKAANPHEIARKLEERDA